MGKTVLNRLMSQLQSRETGRYAFHKSCLTGEHRGQGWGLMLLGVLSPGNVLQGCSKASGSTFNDLGTH